MYELSIEREFCAAHAIEMQGEREPVHGHNWRVTVVVAGDTLDADGLLCDFHEIERSLDGILAPWRNANLNDSEPFDQINPTAELIAREIGERIRRTLPDGVGLLSASVTEAPGCRATYRPARNG